MAKTPTAKLRLSTREKLALYADLSTMLQAGIPILEAVESLVADAKGGSKKVLDRLRRSLYNGESLASILAQMPEAFDNIDVNLIRAAEAGGTLEATLRDMVTATKKEIAFSEQLRNTMIYPAFVMAVFLAIVVLMLTFVVPRISEVFSSINVHMPWITRQMIKASRQFTAHWLIIIGVAALLVALAVTAVRLQSRHLVRWLLSLPLLRRLGTNIDLTRFTRSLGLLMRAGVPITEALDLSQRVVQKPALVDTIEQMKRDIADGKPLAASLDDPDNHIPTIMARSIRTAETSGTLDQTLENLSTYFDEQVTETVRVLSSLIEPVLIVLVGILVGGLMLAIIAPIYSMISQINGTSGG